MSCIFIKAKTLRFMDKINTAIISIFWLLAFAMPCSAQDSARGSLGINDTIDLGERGSPVSTARQYRPPRRSSSASGSASAHEGIASEPRARVDSEDNAASPARGQSDSEYPGEDGAESRIPAPSNRRADSSFFDEIYIRDAVFYGLPYSEIPDEELTSYQSKKLVSILKNRLVAYKIALSKIENRLEGLGESPSDSESAAKSAAGAKKMPVVVNGKTVDAIHGILEAKSKTGEATAFFAEIKNRYFIVTNLHVMRSASEVNFSTYNGVEIKMPKVGYYSRGKDVFMMPINSLPEGCIALPIEEDVSASVSVGDDIVICGNSLGGGTFLHSNGKVVSVGPSQIEHSCNTQPGHSGSPIYSAKSKKVIGVLSHVMRFSTTDGKVVIGKSPKMTLKVRSRYFGYRFDNIKDWTQIKTDKLIEMSKDMEDFINKYEQIQMAIEENKYQNRYDYPEIQKIIVSFLNKKKGSNTAFNAARIELLESLKNLISHEMSAMKSRKLDEIFTDAVQCLDNFEKLKNDCDVQIRLLK